jgi:hypothetical protein
VKLSHKYRKASKRCGWKAWDCDQAR